MKPTIRTPIATGRYAQEFLGFHKKNPVVYQILVRNARRLKEQGYTRIGIRMLWEVMRWEMMLSVSDPSQGEFKFNDHYTRHYARLIMRQEKDLEGIFEIREGRF